ncbi:hypothetical protein [Nocardia arthritidis]|uniref:Uncharacterized protein n=1 Tax=Nocardia arthritidis TaxID=228602 RepID=A0A6G9YSS2_9NOCA|nr:hypothetical protein F5544_42785 [Nocardia arthritidis]
MTAMWFGLATIALVGAIVLLYFDRKQRQRTGHARQVWAKAQGYTYVSLEPALPSTWRRGALAKLGYLSAVDVVSGIRKGEKFVLFDLEDSATLVAVRRQIGSDIDIDMRLKTASPPKDADLELLGAIGDRVVFATNPEIARHAVDQRMVAFIESLPDSVQMLWSEGNWTLGMLSVGTIAREWETAIDAVLRLSGLLHVLPPVSEPRGMDGAGHDPGRPHPRQRGREAEPDEFDDERDDYPRSGRPQREPFEEPEEHEAPRRPSLAVVPDARAKARAEWQNDDWPDDDEEWAEKPNRPEPHQESAETPEQAGGPFHPGFRPYQGPVPQ